MKHPIPDKLFEQYVQNLSLEIKEYQLYFILREDVTSLILKRDREEREETQRALNERNKAHESLLERFNIGQNAQGFNSTAHCVFDASRAVGWNPSIRFLHRRDKNEKPGFISRIKRVREEKENIEPEDNKAGSVVKKDKSGINHSSKRPCISR